MEADPITRACRAAGGTQSLAATLGITTQAISQWRRVRIPAERVLDIERATGGEVTRHELRPDIYPAEAAQ